MYDWKNDVWFWINCCVNKMNEFKWSFVYGWEQKNSLPICRDLPKNIFNKVAKSMFQTCIGLKSVNTCWSLYLSINLPVFLIEYNIDVLSKLLMELRILNEGTLQFNSSSIIKHLWEIPQITLFQMKTLVISLNMFLGRSPGPWVTRGHHGLYYINMIHFRSQKFDASFSVMCNYLMIFWYNTLILSNNSKTQKIKLMI